MKLALVVQILCLVVLAVSAGKNQKQDYQEKHGKHSSREHDLKKYGNDESHHHHHKKHISEKYLHENKDAKKEKKQKQVSKSAPYEVPPEEAEYQANIRASKKYMKHQQAKAEEHLHLQDLSYEEKLKSGSPRRSPHEYQRGHHKTNQHFTHHNVKTQEKNAPIEEKLFEEQSPKEKIPEISPPVLEDSFEALNGNEGSKKHLKKGSKQKKANHKGKKDKKTKKEKKNKKEKFQKW